MGLSAVTNLLILLASVTSCLKLVADNTILDDIKAANDSSIVIIIVNNTIPDNKTLENNINMSNTTVPHETNSAASDDTLSNISYGTTIIKYQSTESTISITTSTDDDSPTATIIRNPEIIPPDNTTSTSAATSQHDNTVTRSSGATDEVDLPDQSVQKIDNLEVENIVQTTYGAVKGFQWREIPDVLAYIDIPYGTFEAYFKPPVSPEAWDLVHEVTEHKKRCPQIVEDTYVGDLDCLTLSIFAPINPMNASVLFHIHESHFSSGSGDPAKYGPEYLVSRGIILVIPNYRLGPLGFLCLRNETAPGNAALKDLTLALNWTKNNIHAFGGDPYDITLSGDGSSGALVGYLALSSKSSHYINKVITESGSVLSHWAIDRNPDVTAVTLAEKIRQREDNVYNNIFAEAEIETIVRTGKDVVMRPCIEYGEDAFINHSPWEMLHQTHINMTYMMGSANLAGAREAYLKTEDSLAHLNEDFSEFLPNDLRFKNHKERNEIGERVKTLYFKGHNISVEHVRELALCFTDASYLGPGIRTARPLVRAGSTVYLYEFSFVGLLNRELIAISKTLDGAAKGDIVGYLFTQDGFIPPDDTEERRVVNLMADLWASFVKTGKPTAEDIEWDPLSSSEDSDEVYLSIGSHCEQIHGIHVDRIRLWTEIYNEHFIEHNHAFTHKASVVAVFVILIFWLGFCKNSTHL